MAVIPNLLLKRYEYGVHVRKGDQLYIMSEKKIYFGKWLIGNNPPIVIIEMRKQVAECEEPFYLEVNNHENIIRTFGSIASPLDLRILVQEYAREGDLADCLMDNKVPSTQSILVPMFVQIATAMSHVASKNIVHGDLGCRNVLVFQVDTINPRNSLVKITDFGLARWIDRPPSNEDQKIVPIRYCAPEILRHNRHESYSEKSDVYSLGVLIWEALSNSEIPYSSVTEDADVKRQKLNNERLPQPKVCERQLWIMMNDCWDKDAQQRPTFDEIKEKLANMKITEVRHDLITDTSHKARIHCDYELDIDVKIPRFSKDKYPLIHEARWKIRNEDEEGPVVVIERKEEPSEHEKLFYSTFKRHSHIIHTHGFVENDRGSVMILQERAPHGNLQSLLESGEFQPSATVLVEIFKQIIDAMIDIAAHGLVHGNLSCENIFVFRMHPTDPERNLVKVANFTFARPDDLEYIDDRRLLVPVRYCALEILRSAGRSNYSELSDVYSMGVLMWQAFAQGRVPYASSKINGEVRQRKMKGEKLSRPLSCHQIVWSIIEDCWYNEPPLRYQFKEMNIRFTNIGQRSVEPYQYELNKDVKQNGVLAGGDGRFYEADWISKRDQPVLLLVLDGSAAEHEAMLTLNFESYPHIIRTYGLVKNDQRSLMLLQERSVHGDLQALLHTGNFQPSASVLVAIFLQIADAMIYITDQGLVHGDLRCANVLVFEMNQSEPKKNIVKLTGFRSARRKDERVVGYGLPDSEVRYSAPELLRSRDGSVYSELSDVYAMGVLMWEVCSNGAVPYGHGTSDQSVRERVLENIKLTRPKACHAEIWQLIEGCCCTETSLRWTFAEIKIQLSNIKIKPHRNMLLRNGQNSFPEDELQLHQKSHLLPINPVEYIDLDDINQWGYPNPRYIHDKRENPVRHSTKRPSVESARSVSRSSCIYCLHPFLDSEMQAHLSKCSVQTLFSVDDSQAKQSYVTCDRCNQQFTIKQIVNHQRDCTELPGEVVVNQPRPRNQSSSEGLAGLDFVRISVSTAKKLVVQNEITDTYQF